MVIISSALIIRTRQQSSRGKILSDTNARKQSLHNKTVVTQTGRIDEKIKLLLPPGAGEKKKNIARN